MKNFNIIKASKIRLAIHKAMCKKGLTPADLHNLIPNRAISKSTIYRFCNAESATTLKNLDLICNVLDMEIK